MKIEDPRSVTSSPILRPATPAPAQTQAKPSRPEAAAPAQTPHQPAARVELSSRSHELHKALESASAAPDVRADKVAEARQRIAQGTYTVNADAVARGILDTKA